MNDRFEPTRVQGEYLARVGMRDTLVALTRDASMILLPEYEFSRENETKRTAAARALLYILKEHIQVIPPATVLKAVQRMETVALLSAADRMIAFYELGPSITEEERRG